MEGGQEMMPRCLQKCRQRSQESWQALARGLDTSPTVQSKVKTVTNSQHATLTHSQKILRQDLLRRLTRQDMPQLQQGAATRKWSRLFAARSRPWDSRFVTRVLFRVFSIGLIAPVMIQFMTNSMLMMNSAITSTMPKPSRNSKKGSSWAGLAFLPCALG